MNLFSFDSDAQCQAEFRTEILVLSTPAGWTRVRSARSAELSTLPFGESFCLTLLNPTSGTPFVLVRRARNSGGACSGRTPAQSPVSDKPFRSVRPRSEE